MREHVLFDMGTLLGFKTRNNLGSGSLGTPCYCLVKRWTCEVVLEKERVWYGLAGKNQEVECSNSEGHGRELEAPPSVVSIHSHHLRSVRKQSTELVTGIAFSLQDLPLLKSR
jgi:hypothetical protein